MPHPTSRPFVRCRAVLTLLALVVAVFTSACGGATASSDGASARPELKSGAALETYFPLEEGRLYHYVTTEAGEPGMLVARVHRVDATHGELRLSNTSKRFVYSAEGVAYDGGAFILKAPIDVGATWPGEHGGTTRVASVSASPKVAAGSYASCVQTVEEGGRTPGARYTTTYCPGIGMVLLEVAVSGGEARAELKSYGMPVKID